MPFGSGHLSFPLSTFPLSVLVICHSPLSTLPLPLEAKADAERMRLDEPTARQESATASPELPGHGLAIGFAGGRVKRAGGRRLTGFGIRTVVAPKSGHRNMTLGAAAPHSRRSRFDPQS